MHTNVSRLVFIFIQCKMQIIHTHIEHDFLEYISRAIFNNQNGAVAQFQTHPLCFTYLGIKNIQINIKTLP